MARQQQVIETVICDMCGKQTDEASTVVLGWGKDQWQLDLCKADNTKIGKTFDTWIAGGRKVRARRASGKAVRPAKSRPGQSGSDWDYLETLGFKRHRGRKSTAELEALAARG